MKLVAVEGCTIKYMAGAVPATVAATLGPASPNVKAEGHGVYVDGTGLTATSWTIGAYAGGGSIVASFESYAGFVNVDGRKVLLEGDAAEFDVSATNPSTGDTQTFTITATIQTAGQESVKAD